MSSAILLQAACRATILLAGVWVALKFWTDGSAARRHALLGACAALLFLAWLPGFPKTSVTSAVLFTFDAPVIAPMLASAPPASVSPAGPDISWWQVAGMVYFAGVGLLLLRLMIGSIALRRRLSDAREVTPLPLGPICLESSQTSVPFTAGFLRPVIVLPEDWHSWPEKQLEAVLAHESAHVARRDALFQFLARLQQALFWFHPGASWLNRKLEAAADEACDDIAVHHTGDPVAYAETLWAFASRSGLRLPAAALPMARPSGVSARIERTLAGGGSRLTLTLRDILRLALVLIPLAAAAAVLQFAQSPQASADFERTDRELLAQGTRLTDRDAAQLEAQLKSHPDDENARGRLIAFYFTESRKQERLGHVLWLIEHRADSSVLATRFARLNDSDTALDDRVAYNTARNLWQQHVQLAPKNARIQFNAACFFRGADPDRALSLVKQARQIEPAENAYVGPMAALYRQLLAGPSSKKYAGELLTSNDVELLRRLGPQLTSGGSTELSALGQQLTARAVSMGAPPPPAKIENAVSLQPVVTPLPMYPPLARQARIEGTVRFAVVVGIDGSVTDSRVLSGHPLLVQSATEAVRKYRYGPQASPVRTSAYVIFALQEPLPSNLYRIGDGVSAPVLIYKLEPSYPDDLRDEKVEGIVLLSAVINTDGQVQNAAVEKGDPRFGAAAIDAVHQWRFKPGIKDGKPVNVQARIEVNFKLN